MTRTAAGNIDRLSAPPAQLQIDFAFTLEQIREMHLQDALHNAIATPDNTVIDAELQKSVHSETLAKLANQGLREDFMFACHMSCARLLPLSTRPRPS